MGTRKTGRSEKGNRLETIGTRTMGEDADIEHGLDYDKRRAASKVGLNEGGRWSVYGATRTSPLRTDFGSRAHLRLQ